MRLIGKVGGLVVLMSALPLTLAAGASAASAPAPQHAQTTPAHAQYWAMDGGRAGHASPQNAIGICKGSFEGPQADLKDGMSAGVFVQCPESVPITAGIILQRCERVGGPDDFDCWNVASNYSGLVVQYYVNVPVSYKCSHSKSALYRPIATRLSVQGKSHPDVVGNVVTVGCG
jgi:hypothetical protein